MVLLYVIRALLPVSLKSSILGNCIPYWLCFPVSLTSSILGNNCTVYLICCASCA